MLSFANYVCLLALSSGIYGRESTPKHGTAWHRTQDTTTHGHRMALRRAAPLNYLS